MAELLFKISNHHTAGCGEPPILDGDQTGRYLGYFANEYGEQAIYEYDYQTGEATVRMGDIGWDNARRVVDGQVADLMLTKSELAWIYACWLATGGREEAQLLMTPAERLNH